MNKDKEGSFLLECPPPDKGGYVVWYKDGEEVEFEARFQYPSGLGIRITELTLDDSGTYTCQDPIAIEPLILKTFVVKVVGKLFSF